MGIMVYSLLWVMQDFVHQPLSLDPLKGSRRDTIRVARGVWYTYKGLGLQGLGFKV